MSQTGKCDRCGLCNTGCPGQAPCKCTAEEIILFETGIDVAGNREEAIKTFSDAMEIDPSQLGSDIYYDEKGNPVVTHVNSVRLKANRREILSSKLKDIDGIQNNNEENQTS